MILIDSNLIVYALNRSSPKHKKVQEFLQANVSRIALSYQNILETIRVLTHHKFSHRLKISEVIEAINHFLEVATIITPSDSTIYLTIELINKHKLSSNRIFDAYLAATALSNSINTIATDNTKDFKKFTQIKTLNPFK